VGKGLLADAYVGVYRYLKYQELGPSLVHAIDDDAKAFYLKYNFVEFPLGSRIMFLPLDTIVAAL
jgi:hypothetical protein